MPSTVTFEWMNFQRCRGDSDSTKVLLLIYPGVRKQAVSERDVMDTCFIDTKTKADIFKARRHCLIS